MKATSRRNILAGAGALAIGAAVPAAAIPATSPEAEYGALAATLRHMIELTAKSNGDDDCPHMAAYFSALSGIVERDQSTLLGALVRFYCGYGAAPSDGTEDDYCWDITVGRMEDDLWAMAEASEPARAAEFRSLLNRLYKFKPGAV